MLKNNSKQRIARVSSKRYRKKTSDEQKGKKTTPVATKEQTNTSNSCFEKQGKQNEGKEKI